MPEHIYIDGVQLDSDQCFLTSFRDGSAAPIDLNSYARGGRSGVSLGIPFYRGFSMSMEFVVTGADFTDLQVQRDRFLSLLRLRTDKTVSQTKRLGVGMSDGTVREVPAIIGPVNGDISADDKLSSTFIVTARTELEFWTETEDKTTTLNVFDAGGMGIPTGIPMNMATSPAQLTTPITNAGNAEFYPTMRIHGALNTFDLTSEMIGKTLSYSGNLTSGHYVDLDFYNRTAVLDGTTNALASVTGDWFWLEPGSNMIKLTTTSGTGYATVTYRDAFRGV